MMREDLQDNTPGKMMAQSAHAQADFDQWVDDNPGSEYMPYIVQWKEDRSFGRTLVLESNLGQIGDMTSQWMGTAVPTGVTVDPTYPWRNFYGKVFLTSEVTCAWVFACDLTPPQLLEDLQKLSLHR
jgi:hypothetical protein